MNCPFCNNTMEKGLLQSGQIMLWTKKRHYVFLNAKDGEVELARDFLGGCHLPAWICKACEKIVVDYSQETDK